jgi:hypothetical protein
VSQIVLLENSGMALKLSRTSRIVEDLRNLLKVFSILSNSIDELKILSFCPRAIIRFLSFDSRWLLGLLSDLFKSVRRFSRKED